MVSDEIDISGIRRRSKRIWVKKEHWIYLKKIFNEGTEKNIVEETLQAISKNGKRGDAVCLKVFEKKHQDFHHNCLGNDEEIIRVGINLECFEELTELKSITCDLFGQKETEEWIKNGSTDVIIITIMRPRKFKEIERALHNSRKWKHFKERLKEKKKSKVGVKA